MAETIAFYSYKGGVGRSLSLANVGVLLSQKGKRVVCIDFDLEAGGLHTIFGIQISDNQLTVLDILSSPGKPFLNGRLFDLTDLVVPSDTPGKLWLLPTVSEIKKIEEALEPQRDLPTLLGRIIKQIEDSYNPHFILIDSRTGFAELASPPIRKADRLVCVLRPNRQNADGLRMLLDILDTLRERPPTYLLLSQVPVAETDDYRIQSLEKKLGRGRRFDGFVPYDPDLAFEEEVAAIKAPNSPVAKSYSSLIQWLLEDKIG
jgi:MinD-like ATPase involved in chromosome partitioning or flagellar assembly